MENKDDETLSYADYRKLVGKLNGTNFIFEDAEGAILFGKSASPDKEGHYRYMLIGGGIERGEAPRHAGCMEVTEETGMVVEEEDVDFIGFFLQRVPKVTEANGTVFMYLVKKFTGTPQVSEEITGYKHFSHAEIIALAQDENQTVIGLGYLRMVCHYIRWKQLGKKRPIEARLSDPVTIPSLAGQSLIEV